MAADSHWAATAAALRSRLKDYADGTVCFDPLTGETRLLTPLAGYLLDNARSGEAQSRADILAELVDPQDDAEQRREVAAHLDETAQLLIDTGLIVPC